MKTPLLLAAAAALFPLAAAAQATPASALLALSKHDHTLAIVDPATMKVVARVPVGDDPHEVVASADGKTAWVSNYGFGSFHTLTAVDLVGQKPAGVVDLGALRGPHGLDFAQGKVWFTAEAAKAIGSYDPSTGKIDWIMGTGQHRTHMIAVVAGGKRIVTTNVSSETATILDHIDGPAVPMGPPPPGMMPPPAGAGSGAGANPGPPPGRMPGPPGGDWKLTVVPTGKGGEGFDVSPDGREAWVANAWDGTITVIELESGKVLATLEANVRGANRLKFTPDGRLALVSADSALVVLDAGTRKQVKRLNSVHAGGGIQMDPAGARAYVACGRDNQVTAIDLKTLEAVGSVDVGGEPDGLAWAARP